MKMKPEHHEFIKTQAMKGCSATFIKKELDIMYQHEATPSRTSIDRWTAFYKASFRGSAFDPDSNLSSMINKKYRNVIEKGVNEGKHVSKISKRLWKRYGKESVSRQTISLWYKRFKCAHESSAAKRNDESTLQQLSTESKKLIERKSEKLKLKHEPEIILIEDSLDSVDRKSPTESQIGDQNGRESKSGLYQNLEPGKILGDAVMNGIRLFMIEWKNSLTNDLCKF